MNNTNDNREKVGYIVDLNGEIIKDLYTGDKVINSTPSEYAEEYIINFNKKEGFVKMFVNPLVELHRELSTRENSVVMGLIPFISYKDGVLRCDGKILDIKTMSEILDEEYGGFRKTILSLINKEIIKKIDIQSDRDPNKMKKCFVVNPFIFFRGTDMKRDIACYFIDSKWADYYKNK